MQEYKVSSSVVVEAHDESDAIRIFRHHMACGDGKVQAEQTKKEIVDVCE